MALQDYFQELVQDEAALKHSRLVQMSALNEEELDEFRCWWPSIPVEHRRTVVLRLVPYYG